MPSKGGKAKKLRAIFIRECAPPAGRRGSKLTEGVRGTDPNTLSKLKELWTRAKDVVKSVLAAVRPPRLSRARVTVGRQSKRSREALDQGKAAALQAIAVAAIQEHRLRKLNEVRSSCRGLG